LSEDPAKADRAEDVIAAGGVISVQVLNEFALVAPRKLRMPWFETRELLDIIRRLCRVEALSLETHDCYVSL